ncbi:MAG: alpha/beta hydrolase [Sciscionella sp.]
MRASRRSSPRTSNQRNPSASGSSTAIDAAGPARRHRREHSALRAFLTACAADMRCAFRQPGTDMLTKYNTVLRRLRQHPVTITDPETGAPTEVRYQDAIGRFRTALEDAANSPALARLLQDLYDAPETTAPATRAAQPAAAPPVDYNAPLRGGAVLCADSVNPTNPRLWSGFAHRADRAAPGFGSLFTYLSLPCATWPGTDADRYTGPWNRGTAEPVLLIGNSQGDPDTPYAGARRTAALLGDGRLLTLDSFGHGARGKSRCVDGALDRYFIALRPPAAGTVCQPDSAPFDGRPAAHRQGR